MKLSEVKSALTKLYVKRAYKHFKFEKSFNETITTYNTLDKKELEKWGIFEEEPLEYGTTEREPTDLEFAKKITKTDISEQQLEVLDSLIELDSDLKYVAMVYLGKKMVRGIFKELQKPIVLINKKGDQLLFILDSGKTKTFKPNDGYIDTKELWT